LFCVCLLFGGVCLGILPVNILHFSQSTSAYSSSSCLPYCWAVSSVFHCVLFLHRCVYFNIIRYHSLLLSLLP
jgi:hypothetical protein